MSKSDYYNLKILNNCRNLYSYKDFLELILWIDNLVKLKINYQISFLIFQKNYKLAIS